MSIGVALSNALSGLTASTKRAEVISDNVANALTPGYARRSLTVSAAVAAGEGRGVRMHEVVRAVDPRATFERRAAQSTLGREQAFAGPQSVLADAIGAADQVGSLSSRAIALEDAIARLAETPEAPSLQQGAVTAAGDLARALVSASRDVQSTRMDAETAITRMVEQANDSLARIDALNEDIATATAGGRSTAALEEARGEEIDRLAEIIPVRTARRDQGVLAIYTPGGAVLLEGRPALLEFDAKSLITADMTLASTGLNALILDGEPIAAGTGDGPLDGGALGAQFAIRDVAAPEAQAQLDAIAQDLILRFEDPAVDPTLAPGDPGLFTDEGGAFDPLDVVGLAARIEINAAVDPAQGGAAWRMRDGINAVVEGPAGLDTLSRAHLAAMREPMATPAGSGVSGSRSFMDLVDSVASLRARAAADAEAAAAFADGRYAIKAEAEASSTGVDSDREMSDLLLVEQAYAANARVLQTLDGLLRRLLDI
ncbi:flagellar hook-associated protein FlgK [Albimonas pacifica]|uniref:Flagellar hook-associated protein 1 n=1 Tax=Albimonas pacifica TaxID=1114924 RepID=A0A1I3FKY7_9RHOB|nr:flagellar hook-associated protein FlgK [Albimonas pacifica]SFI11893.1 flagellar hook-associated protein 1 FlgK [Albimonas pacifica]